MRRPNRVLRGALGALALLVLAGWVLWPTYSASGPLAPSGLKCEYLSNPMGIDVRLPRLSWVLNHTERGQKQTAYQVLVATRPELLDQDKADHWDTGKVASEESTLVAYGGKALESGRAYYWKVRTWDAAETASAYSRPAQFEMGLLAKDEWKGLWIAGDNQFRKEVTLAARPLRARAYVTAAGYYELRINGEKVGPNVLDPAWTTYDKRVLYTTYDVTPHLKAGANALGVMLGGGWATLGGDKSAPIQRYYDQPGFLLQVNIELEGGKTASVASDASWKTARGPIVADSVFDGEIYDARLEAPGWDRPGFIDASWTAAKPFTGNVGEVSAQMMPPIRVVDTLVPIALTNPKAGVYVFDLGQNISGWAELRVSGPRGASVTIRFAELVYENGTINRENLRHAKSRDVYTLKGDGGEVYEPRFTYHGFRYVELRGFPGTPNLDSIRGKVVHSAVGTTGGFSASNPLLNKIQRLIRWGQLTNLHSVPTDCPQRDERMGWMGDAQVTAEEAMLNFDMAAFFSNFVRNIRDIQGEDGTVTDTVPHKYGSRPADPAWGTAFPRLCWYMYEQYGDRRILEENYDGLKKYVEFLRTRAQDNVLRYSYYGDWVPVVRTPGEIVSASYYYWDVLTLSKAAEVLGKTSDAQTYSQLAAQIKDAYNQAFLNPRTGNYSTGTQTANALALYLDLVPESPPQPGTPPLRGIVQFNLTQDILYEHDSHLTTGFIGVKYLFPVLTRMGRSDLAYDVVAQTSYPGWGYMVASGATTLWELWQQKTGPSMNSHNHPMFGSIGAWFYQALGGINVDMGAGGPGYKHIVIQPQIVRDLKWASAKVETVRGTVSSSWTHSPGEITVDVEVPVNSDAKVIIPKDPEMTDLVVREGDRVVWEKGKYVADVPGVTGASTGTRDVSFLAPSSNSIVIGIGSGRYSFKLTGQ